jgi:hypothetical protein
MTRRQPPIAVAERAAMNAALRRAPRALVEPEPEPGEAPTAVRIDQGVFGTLEDRPVSMNDLLRAAWRGWPTM